jgi:putative FmdB family regulatory protein
MPTYEFRCPEGHEFEKFYRSIAAAPRETTCPTCGKVAERLMSAGGGLVFKGSGFYITDYGKDGKKPQTAPAADSGGSTAEAAPKSETAAKAEPKPVDAKPEAGSKSGASKAIDKPASSKKATSDE